MVKKDILPNGIRVVTETVPYVHSVSIGIWVKSGARDEDDCNRGISHFIEHMLFKGTETRTAKQIADEFDSVGGHLNAFTEKEYACYFAKILKEHFPPAVEVLADMFLNSIFDPAEIVLEKNVVLEEIKRHEDSPDDLVHDMFAQTVWNEHPLGRSVIGVRESVEGLVRDDLVEFMQSHYTPGNVVIAAAGNLAHEGLVEQVSRLFGAMDGFARAPARTAPLFSTETKLTTKSTEQVHFCIGTRGFSQLDDEKYPLAIIDATLGGGMGSRLFQEIRERRGLVYAIGSYSTSYSEGGLFAVYGGTSLENVGEVLTLVRAEFEDLRRSGVSESELNRAKNQIRGVLVLGQENMSSRMVRLGKSELYFGRVIPIEELIEKITKVADEDVRRVAECIFESEFPMAAIGPFENQEILAHS